MYKERLPYSQSALILGISSIFIACCCWGLIGIVLGVFGLYYANKAIAIYNENPHDFDGIKNAETGRTTAIIGIAIGVISSIYMAYLFYTGEYSMIIEQFEEMNFE